MAMKVCVEPGCPVLVRDGSRCPPHARDVDRRRGSRPARGYDAEHDRLRREWAPKVATGTIRCANPDCRRIIGPCRAVPCRAVPCRAVPCRAVPWLAQAEFDATAEASDRAGPIKGSYRLEYLTEDEVSEYLRVPVNTLWDWRRKDAVKVLPFHRIGRLIRYERTEIDAAMRAGLAEAPPDRYA